MQTNNNSFVATELNLLKIKMLNWASRFSIFCLLDSNNYVDRYGEFDLLLGAGVKRSFTFSENNSFENFQQFFDESPCWLMGHLGYGLKSETEKVPDTSEPFVNFGNGFFFEPEYLLAVRNGKLEILLSSMEEAKLLEEINNEPENIETFTLGSFEIETESKQHYETIFKKLHAHIHAGDCYEINYCKFFSAEEAEVHPLLTYLALTQASPMPFAALYKLDNKYCICASPERYLKKSGDKIISQPMKGTARRDLENEQHDIELKNSLANNPKEQSENVMIVDLVRNDLSRTCTRASVQVEELFGVHTFSTVHQMISTVVGKLPNAFPFTQVINTTFPMGSMTGAPKHRVLQIIDENEVAARGLFSGSIGYITPTADFDFNVVIRSIFFDEERRKLSFMAGSALTFNSLADKEYEECLVKAAGMLKVLS